MKHLIVGILLVLTACSYTNAEVRKTDETETYYILLSNLLDVNQDRHTFTYASGVKQLDSLAAFKELERIYTQYIQPDMKNNTYSENRIKIILLFAFYAQQHHSAAFNEYLATDLMPIYMNNKTRFLKVLSELPFLTSASCNRLDKYFGFEGRSSDKKPAFITENKKRFTTMLNSSQMKECQALFNPQVSYQ